METYQTPFGEIQVDPETVIVFPSGMPGLPACQRYKLLHEDNPNPRVMWLQSLNDPAVFFNVVEAASLGLSYQVSLSDEECAEIGLDGTDEACLLLILSRGGDTQPGIAANTQAPIVLNARTRKALQKSGVRANVVFSNI